MDSQKQKIADIVAAKFYREDTEEEVREWLATEKMITGERADFFIHYGLNDKQKEVRKRAVMRLTFASIGLSLFIGFLMLQYFGEFALIGLPVIFVWILGISSFGITLRSLYELCSGKSKQPM